MSIYLFEILNGVALGMIYFLMAAGLTIIFGMMNFVNFAHGSLYALGAYFCFQIIDWGGNYWVGLLVAPILVGLIALALERTLIRRLYAFDHPTQILITIGVMLVLREIILLLWGTVPKPITPPEALSGVLILGDFVYPYYRLFVITVTCVVGLLIWLMLDRTRFGIMIRAGSENAKMVSLLGLNSNLLFSATFVLGVALAGLGGALISPIRGADAFMGAEALGIAFVVVVIGGMGSFPGALAGAMVVGLVQSLSAGIWPEGTNIMIYAVMAMIILLRPNGLFGRA
ncbi:branched-chain amino acid ABC transporter permease [Neptuniibacter halophilus]|uniref:branched-chain amino acid ABC transporter permease n=1 Tax=Neptuniibacter halophilus TaxID=651666 RepID=UPI0025748CE6|nr:branched-chain amino acid ABC transporter permease [Neptuniibacter halophilus]